MLFTRSKKQLGYAVIIDPLTSAQEIDSLTCYHCGTVVWMKPFADGAAMGGHCTICDRYICLNCVGKGCTPFEKRMEQEERRRQYGLIGSG